MCNEDELCGVCLCVCVCVCVCETERMGTCVSLCVCVCMHVYLTVCVLILLEYIDTVSEKTTSGMYIQIYILQREEMEGAQIILKQFSFFNKM